MTGTERLPVLAGLLNSDWDRDQWGCWIYQAIEGIDEIVDKALDLVLDVLAQAGLLFVLRHCFPEFSMGLPGGGGQPCRPAVGQNRRHFV